MDEVKSYKINWLILYYGPSQRIRGFWRCSLYKFTFYLLTYVYMLYILRAATRCCGETYDNSTNEHHSNLVKREIVVHQTLRLHSPDGSSNLQLHVLAVSLTPQISPSPEGHLTQCVIGPDPCIYQMASKSVERFKQGAARVRRTDDRPRYIYQAWTRVGSTRGSGRVGSKFLKCVIFQSS